MWLEAIEAMTKLKYERMKVLNSVNRVTKVSHDKLKESLVAGVHDALAKFLAHEPRQTREAGAPSGILGFIYVRGHLSRFFVVLNRI